MRFTTSRGTVIPPFILTIAADQLEEGRDEQDVMNYTLRNHIPVRDGDDEEAREVISYLEDEINDAWVERQWAQ